MILLKGVILIAIFFLATALGITMSNKYKNRTKDLKEIRNILNILETKIKYTYEPLPTIFSEISQEFNDNIGKIFEVSKEKMKEISAGDAWKYGVENSNTSMNEEDLKILKSFENLLGKTNVEGQLSEINLVKKFIDTQIQKAEEEQRKNEKLYRNLGVIVGIMIVIILI